MSQAFCKFLFSSVGALDYYFFVMLLTAVNVERYVVRVAG